MILEFQDNVFCCEIIGCSFALGVISYDEEEQVESIDATAIGILEFNCEEDVQCRQMLNLPRLKSQDSWVKPPLGS